MNRTKLLFSLILLLALLALQFPSRALADDTQPPADAPTQAAPADNLAAPDAATDVPADVPTDVADPTKNPADLPTEQVGAVASETPTVEAILAQAPDGTAIVALDSQGDALPLATQAAAQIILSGDPMWCPDGVLPGGSGCTAAYSTFNGDGGSDPGLLSVLGSASGNGTIYIAENYDSSLEQSSTITLDGTVFSGLGNLTLQGGWNGMPGVDAAITGTSLFDGVSLSIANWGSDVAVNDIDVANTADGLDIATGGDVDLNNVNVTNTGLGAAISINSGENVTLNDVDTSVNYNGDGIDVLAGGSITGNNLSANSNDTGVRLDNHAGSGNVTLTGSNTFNLNYNSGLLVSSAGDVNLNNITANENGATYTLTGVGIANYWGTGDVTITGENSFNDTLLGYGLYVMSNGDISVDNSSAKRDYLVGIQLDNSNGSGAIFLTDATVTDNQFAGLVIYSTGDVFVENLNASDNHFSGALIQTDQDVLISGNSIVNANHYDGLNVWSSYGNISLDNVSLVGNGTSVFSGWGATLENDFGTGNITVTAGSFEANALDGLVILSNGVVDICQSNFTANGGYGLSVVDANSLILGGDTFSGNSQGDYNAPNSAVTVENNCEHKPKAHAELSSLPFNTMSVNGGEQVRLDCDRFRGTVLMLPNGDQIILPCPIHDAASLARIGEDGLPGSLPNGFKFLSAIQTGLFASGEAEDAIPGVMTVALSIPEDSSAENLTILYWDGTQWIDLAVGPLPEGKAVFFGLTALDGYIKTGVDFTGIFALVSK